MSKNIHEFTNGEQILRRYNVLIDKEYNYRRKVAYKGENGNKFQLLKEFAELCIGEASNG